MVNLFFSSLSTALSSFLKTTVVVVGLFEESTELKDNGFLINQNTKIMNTVHKMNFKPKIGKSLLISNVDDSNGSVLVVGLGKIEKWNENQALNVGGIIYSELEKINVNNAAVILDYDKDLAAHISYGIFLKSFKFSKYFINKTEEYKPKIEKVTFLIKDEKLKTSVETLAHDLKLEGESIFFARSLVSEPANVLYPEEYAIRIEKELSPLGIKVEIFDEDYLKKQGMNALLAVGQGSHKRSRLVVMTWKGKKDKSAPIAFVGKGVTFDTGGVSLKPSKGMWDMKYDMAGSASVVGIMRALAARKANVNALGVVGLVENAIGGNAQRPGDIVKSMSGQTIEVLNTDAEGRLVLADALWYTQSLYSPKLMIDLATLTGAVVVALGSNQYGGLFSNNDQIAEQLSEAGNEVNEKLWRLPLHKEYDQLINSTIADMQNISTKGYGADSITAAQFLQKFVNNVPWAHLDIAGMAWNHDNTYTSNKGATGFGIKLLNNFIKKYYEN